MNEVEIRAAALAAAVQMTVVTRGWTEQSVIRQAERLAIWIKTGEQVAGGEYWPVGEDLSA